MITVRIKFFAVLRDIVGSGEKVIALPIESRASGIVDALVIDYPEMRKWKEHLRVAVNWEYVPPSYLLQDNDEVAIIPPVSGG